jgi:nitrogen fixation protein NifQ
MINNDNNTASEAAFIPPQPMGLAQKAVYDWLMADSVGDREDNHFFACVIAARCSDTADDKLPASLGLDKNDFLALLSTRFPSAFYSWKLSGEFERSPSLLKQPGLAVENVMAAEEQKDIRKLLLDHRASDRAEEGWIASILAATALHSSHLWEDLGLTGRSEVSQVIKRNFPVLGRMNLGSRMRWKKFFYRKLCEQNGLNICRSPNCQSCDEYSSCFSSDQSEVDRTIGLVWSAN